MVSSKLLNGLLLKDSIGEFSHCLVTIIITMLLFIFQLKSKHMEPDLYKDIINRHLDDLLDDVDKCNNLDDDVEEMLDDTDLDLPS
jgi:hypothetical protein